MDLPDHVEIAVIGAGPAGSTVAAALARCGRRVALFERDEFPRDKVCGEFLSPESMECLKRLGCHDVFSSFSPPAIECVRLTSSSQTETTLALPATARGLSRRRLDEMLFEFAARRGALTIDGAVVRSLDTTGARRTHLVVEQNIDGRRHSHRLSADVVVAAYGRRSHLDRTLQRPSFDKRSPFVAFKRHHRVVRHNHCPPLEGLVELHAFDGGYCGASLVEDGVVNVCTMFDRRLLRTENPSNKNGVFDLVARQSPPLARRLKTLEPCDTKTLAVAPICLTPRNVTQGRILYVGDAAGMIAPLAGDGQAMALEGGLQLAKLIDDSFPAPPIGPWNTIWRHRYQHRLQLGRWLQKALIRPSIATISLHLLHRMPRIGEAILQWTRSPSSGAQHPLPITSPLRRSS